jgi:hypothetical protein
MGDHVRRAGRLTSLFAVASERLVRSLLQRLAVRSDEALCENWRWKFLKLLGFQCFEIPLADASGSSKVLE